MTWSGTSKLGDIYNGAPCDLSILTFCVCTVLSRQTNLPSRARAFVRHVATVGNGGSRSRVRSSAVLPFAVTQKTTVLTEACLSFRSAFAQGSGSAVCW